MATENERIEISHASGSHAWTSDGRCFTDLMIGVGAVFLGHGYPSVTQRLKDQISRVWLCGRYPTPSVAQAHARLCEFLPAGFVPGGLFSTGMEAAEFALRLTAHHSGRREFAGFARSMHGKSAMTASMCWDNAPIRVERVHTVPFVDTVHEDEILGRLSRLLATRRIAALFVEPIQGSNAGHEASTDFYHRAINLCQETGTYCVFDEILTGLYRTGTTFYADRLTVKPDFLLFAKCMGNGFPVSSLAIPQGMALAPAALPGSTFADNPLAAAAVAATLEAMCELDMPKRVAAIDRTVRDALDGREADGLTLRGKGALWLLELGGQIRVADTLAAIRESGVLVSCHGRNIRLLPAATIDLDLLHSACRKIADACLGNRA